jgi:hypothetical protein
VERRSSDDKKNIANYKRPASCHQRFCYADVDLQQDVGCRLVLFIQKQKVSSYMKPVFFMSSAYFSL